MTFITCGGVLLRAVNADAFQAKVDGGSVNGNYSNGKSAQGPYTFIVEGCISNFFGAAKSTCSHWSSPVTVTVPQQPTKPVQQPPQTKSYTLALDHKGDCTLQNPSMIFGSDGSFQFKAQVKTDHTHSGDYWHMLAQVVGVDGSPIHDSAIGASDSLIFTMTSMRMSDDHGFYDWTYTTNFDPRWYPLVGGAHTTNSC